MLLSVAALVIVLSLLSSGGLLLARHAITLPLPTASSAIPQLGPAAPLEWAYDQQHTPVSSTYAAFLTTQHAADPSFQAYYSRHDGIVTLGAALTPAYPTAAGLVQFFTYGALLIPSALDSPQLGRRASAPLAQLASQSTTDDGSGIIRMPLFHTLVTAGSELPLVKTGSDYTYVNLREATLSSAATSAPRSAHGGVFVAEGVVSGRPVGYTIPAPIWSFLTTSDIAPDGWMVDFGEPLTAAIPLTATVNGTPHHLLVQAFWQQVLIEDEDAPAADGQPTVHPLASGADYLRTFGPPPPAYGSAEQEWTTGATAIAVLDAPVSGAATVHLGANFPVTVTAARWIGTQLWYDVSWRTPARSGSGWLPASAVATAAPPAGEAGAAWASFDALSPNLAGYLVAQGANVGVAVYDVTRNTYYTYDGGSTFLMGSSSKIPIMLAYLTGVENQGRGLTSDEDELMTTMIENSNNDSAQALYDALGDGPGVAAYLQSIGVGGYTPDPNGFGWATFPPLSMVQMLLMMYDGRVLNATDRAFAFNLMQNIEPDEQMGVGQTAPQGASVAMKDGWVQGPDTLWAANSSGIVTVGGETYIVSVYTGEQQSLTTDFGILNQVCGAVATALE